MINMGKKSTNLTQTCQNILKKKYSILAYIIVVSFIPSCAVKPEKIAKSEQAEVTKSTLNQLHLSKNIKEFKIDLKQAIALALENNLEYRLKKVQSALFYKQYDLAKTEMYPNIDLSFAYDHRNRDYIKTLGDTSGEASTAQSLVPHTIKRGNVIFNWDILDFGLSYVRAKQAADRYLISQEQRKKMAAEVINDVIKNYTLAYYGQELAKQIKELEQSLADSLDSTDKAIEQNLGEKQQLLEYKKGLVEDFREARDYVTYFGQARDKLLNLLSLNSQQKLEDTPVVLEKPDPYLIKLPAVDSDLLSLDTVSIFNRPEVSESVYKIKETERQKTVAVLEKLPSLGFKLGYNYESDKYLYFQNWWSDNLSLAWNLLHLASIPAALDTAEAQLEAAKFTQLASSAVILSEIRVLLYNYKMKKYDFHLAEKESQFAGDLYQHSLNLSTAGMGKEQDLIRYKLSAVNSELSKLKSFVDARNIFEDLIMAMGLYGTGGELVNKSYVDMAVINKWIALFGSQEFDQIINDQYKNIFASNNLENESKVHQEHAKAKEKERENKKPMHEKPKKDQHARLHVNLPGDSGNLTFAKALNSYLTKLFSYTI